MKKFILSTVITGAAGFAAHAFMPWWIIAPVAFAVSFAIRQKPYLSLLSGFAGIFLLWSVQSYLISASNGHILAGKISELLVKTANPYIGFILTGMVGGLVSGLAALTAAYSYKKTEG